ncbi:MAG: CoA-binding protein [Deltaproteobacteria bacterium CG_4_10_14_3_um_filter_51_14]|nr:CoA-binding protein [bacterium]NCP09352.1 CoA-binding protein [bacterium]PIY24269.1 MAG: CoA-binding protein [Deltaproteobacteria bacterium CG_4_10_14_3_um_filter_51_14]PJB35702.1 MAG: CoA-binding protein [Deltaproteobacteria bacterium CG_4_9_14_3_um_filter_51_14]
MNGHKGCFLEQKEGSIPSASQGSDDIADILNECKVIAVVGLSPKPERDSNRVAAYLISKGYDVVPVNPGQKEILGRKCYKSLSDIPFKVDMANLFINTSRVPPVVDEAIEKAVKVIWMQLGIAHEQSAQKAGARGIRVVMNRCIMAEHRYLYDRIQSPQALKA